AGLPACLAIYYGVAALIAYRWGLHRPHGVFFFALAWFGAELARAHLFTGFPWDMMGYVWADCLPVLQSVHVWGIEGLTLATLLAVVTPVFYFMPTRRCGSHAAFMFSLLFFVAMAAAGWVRLSHGPLSMVPDVRLRLVQPDIDQSLKWKADQRYATFTRLMDLTFSQAGDKPVTHYIWPETATAYYLTEEPTLRSHIAGAMPKGTFLLTGVVRRQFSNGDTPLRYFNSMIAMDSKGTVIAGYDKFHLVPFGEYMPGRNLLHLPVISTMGQDFSAGEGPRSLRVPGLPIFSPLICYEAIFSANVADPEDPPRFLLNLTNDAWYKGTIGPVQHFAIAKVRAVEEGLPLVRVSNAGITGVVDPYGRLTASTHTMKFSYIDADLPEPLPEKNGIFRYRHEIPYLVTILLLVALFVMKLKTVSEPSRFC
ncbi:MAG: apolipoprotein N-acyltransferase, partial [Bdellovibrionales bacterium]